MRTAKATKERMFTTFLVALLLSTRTSSLSTSSTSSSSTSAKLVICPVQVDLTSVTYQHEAIWYRRFVSASPRREYALRNISLCFSQKLTLLTGPSDSGKSTLLQLIRGRVQPTQGTVVISTRFPDDARSSSQIQQQQDGVVSPPPNPVPIYLEMQPDRSGDSRSTREILVKQLEGTYALPPETASFLIHHFAKILDYTETALQQPRSRLSASDVYKLELLLACMDSMLQRDVTDKVLVDVKTAPIYVLPAPILLLDEWLDKETSVVIHRLQDCLCSLANIGAVVCVITHKADRWRDDDGIRRLHLRRGELQHAE